METTKTVYLSNTLNLSITGNFPFTLNICPTGIADVYGSKTHRLEYDFGDGYRVTRSLSLDSNPIDNIETYTYISSVPTSKTINVKVRAYLVGSGSPYEYVINTTLYSPALENIDGYFSEVHLIGSRMFGKDNDMVYIFEGMNPDYIIPVVVNWKTRPYDPISKVTKSPNYRPYRMLQPFEDENVTNPSVDTTIISIKPTVGTGITDNGSPNMRKV